MPLPREFPFPDPADEPDAHARAAVAAWNAIAQLFLAAQGQRDQVAAEVGLNLAELIPLFHLDPAHGTSQRDLAAEWSCDPSWVTNRVDRLEQLGLAERRVAPHDRRVKEVWLTEQGRTVRHTAMRGFARPPAGLRALPEADLQTLARILADAHPDGDGGSGETS